MGRPADLTIDTELNAPSTATSPTSSTFKLPLSAQESVQSVATTAVDSYDAPKPSIRLLFSFLTRHDLLFLVVPAVCTSICSGAVAPFMTLVIGKVFDSFAQFPLTPNPPESAKHQLLHDIGVTALELIGLAAGALLVSLLSHVRRSTVLTADAAEQLDLEPMDMDRRKEPAHCQKGGLLCRNRQRLGVVRHQDGRFE